MAFELPNLPYSKDALAPNISAETLDFHWDKHHRAYVNKLNDLVKGTEFENASLEDIIKRASGAIFNNGAQVWNHTFYWNCLTPKSPGRPSGNLATAINGAFGSFDNFKTEFEKAAVGQFGSGWAWLVLGKDGKLAIRATPNAENPIQKGEKPLFTCDVWEHAYYIDYRNARAKYVSSMWNVANWAFAESNLS
jgi:Fe-Mn family superoxide dismutase